MRHALFIILSLLALHVQAVNLPQPHIAKLKGFPSNEAGIEHGVSACFAGCVGDTLLMAGGCNFPEVPAAKGGTKRYYQGIYAATLTTTDRLQWRQVGMLPQPCAYGVSIQLPDGLLCIGGCNTDSSLTSVYLIKLQESKAVIQNLPSLPMPLDNFTGARQGDTIYVYGGNKIWHLNLSNLDEGWLELTSVKDVRMQPISGMSDGKFCVWGGYTPKSATSPATIHSDGIALSQLGMTKLAPPRVDDKDVFLGGSAAVNLDSDRILVLGGVNGSIFQNALNNPPKGYMSHKASWYQFNPHLFLYDREGWHLLHSTSLTARAGATVALHGNEVYVIGGELKPGIRAASILRIRLIQ